MCATPTEPFTERWTLKAEKPVWYPSPVWALTLLPLNRAGRGFTCRIGRAVPSPQSMPDSAGYSSVSAPMALFFSLLRAASAASCCCLLFVPVCSLRLSPCLCLCPLFFRFASGMYCALEASLSRFICLSAGMWKCDFGELSESASFVFAWYSVCVCVYHCTSQVETALASACIWSEVHTRGRGLERAEQRTVQSSMTDHASRKEEAKHPQRGGSRVYTQGTQITHRVTRATTEGNGE